MKRRAAYAAATAALLAAVACQPDGGSSSGGTGGGGTAGGSTGGQGQQHAPTPRPAKTTTKPKPSPSPWAPKGPASLTSCGTVKYGMNCAFSGSNFKPGEQVTLTRDGQSFALSTQTSDSQGRISIHAILAIIPGTYTFTARGTSSGITATATVEVTR